MVSRKGRSNGRGGFLALLLAGLVLAFGAPQARADSTGVTVYAAASMKTALDTLSAKYLAETGQKVTMVYGASGALAKQIEAGAPADIFVSADPTWIGYLESDRRVDVATQGTLAGNRLVLVAPASDSRSFTIDNGADLAGYLGAGKLAIGIPTTVPAGRYAQQALEKLGIWGSVSGKLAETADVRAALALVARGEAAAGIVYATDARVEPKVRVLGVFPDWSHDPIAYPAIQVAPIRTYPPDKVGKADNPAAAKFLRYLEGAEAQALFQAEGFTKGQ